MIVKFIDEKGMEFMCETMFKDKTEFHSIELKSENFPKIVNKITEKYIGKTNYIFGGCSEQALFYLWEFLCDKEGLSKEERTLKWKELSTYYEE